MPQNLYIKVSAGAGSDIEDCRVEMMKLANRLGITVWCEMNGWNYVSQPGDTVLSRKAFASNHHEKKLTTPPPNPKPETPPEVSDLQGSGGINPLRYSGQPSRQRVMNGQIGVVGYPSRLGGADTELDHQMRVWSKMGLEIHVVHTGVIDDNLRAMRLEDRPGVVIHEPRDWKALKGMPVISYCNGEFLKALPEIREHATAIWWANCMCWLFPAELEAHRRGLIDRFIYQTARVQTDLTEQLSRIREGVSSVLIRPYFDASEFTFEPDKPLDKFRFCRINREDLDKYHPNYWWLPNTFVSPYLKEGHVLGWNEKIEAKVGAPPDFVLCERAGARPVKEVWDKSHVLLHWADPKQFENLPRIGFEAMATGTVIIAENRGGWTEEVIHGETGWLANTDRELCYFASRMAFETKERIEMAVAARDHLETNWGMDQAVKAWGNFFDEN